MAFRFSKRPHKQFLWFLIRQDAKLGRSREVGLDAGCADMKNRIFFETRQYIGLDPDADMLAKGKANYPEAQDYNCTILEAPDIQADFVHCIQVFVNADFQIDEAIEVTQKLISMVKPGGVLLMNLGRQTLQYEDEIQEILQSAFNKVTNVRYGNAGIPEAPLPVSLVIAAAMYLIPPLRLWGGHSKSYFRCTGRKPLLASDQPQTR